MMELMTTVATMKAMMAMIMMNDVLFEEDSN
jgi:hypothetical protein